MGALDGVLRCPTKTLLGVPCPGCGMTRAARLALTGDVAGATAMHPLVWLVVPVVAVTLVLELVGYARDGAWGRAWTRAPIRAAILGTALLLFALWVARFLGAFGGPVP